MSSIEARVSGAEKLMARLGEIQNVVFPVVAKKLSESALAVHRSATISIQAHESQGRTYGSGKTAHTASAPGNPPNSDTGFLIRHIKFELDKEKLVAVVGTNLKYGKYLEMGTKHIRARPWLLPAFEMHRTQILQNIREAIRNSVKGRSA